LSARQVVRFDWADFLCLIIAFPLIYPGTKFFKFILVFILVLILVFWYSNFSLYLENFRFVENSNPLVYPGYSSVFLDLENFLFVENSNPLVYPGYSRISLYLENFRFVENSNPTHARQLARANSRAPT